MTTDAQKARNARKRAKLKAHKLAERMSTPPSWMGPARYVVECRETSLWYSWKHTEYFPADRYYDKFCCSDEVVEAWLNKVLSKFGPGQSKIVPGSFRVTYEELNEWAYYGSPYVREWLPYDLERDLAADLNRLATALKRVA